MLHIVLAFWLASCTADAITSHRDMDTGRVNEVGIFMPAHKWAIDATLAVQATGGALLLTKTPRHTRTYTLAIVAIVAGSTLHTWAAIHNQHVYEVVIARGF